MSHLNNFAYGWFTPALAYIMSSIGSLLGLLLTSRARGSAGASRARWLAGAALSIGGTGIWVMHFIAMMGLAAPGGRIRYDVPLTAASAVLAVVVVGAGLVMVSRGDDRTPALLAGGLLAGIGVAGMHYLGMAAMRMHAEVTYDLPMVALSVIIAVVAATAALWFTLRVRGALATGAAALIMGAAVSGMHYTGMFAMRVRPTPTGAMLSGADGIDFLMPVLAVISLLTVGSLLAVLLSPSERELRTEAELMARLHGASGDARPAAARHAAGRGTARGAADGAAKVQDRPRSAFESHDRP